MSYTNQFYEEKNFISGLTHKIHKDQTSFWKNGYKIINILEGQSKISLLENLKKIYAEKNKLNFIVKEKFKKEKQLDLRENDNFTNFCVEFLKSDNLIGYLNYISCNDLVLTGIKIRINSYYSNKTGFWGEHRDTSLFKGNIKGPVPSMINLAYYPNFGKKDHKIDQLKIWEGSHKKMFNGKLNIFSKLTCKKNIIQSDDNKLVLFDTSLIHSIAKVKNEEGSLRLIYSFKNKNQVNSLVDDVQKISKWEKILNGN